MKEQANLQTSFDIYSRLSQMYGFLFCHIYKSCHKVREEMAFGSIPYNLL